MRGIDISSWQGSVDFNKVKADGIEFCILREGFRKTIDSRFKEYVSGCKSAGIPILGCYHFIYWNGATIKENAVSMVNNIRLAGLDPFDTWLFADLEYDSWTKFGEKPSKSRCTSLTKEFLDALKELGCNKLAIYCNQDYYRNYLDWNVLSDYRDHLWLADYEGEPGYKCSIQQTGSTGKVNGIRGNVDTDTLFDKSMLKGVVKAAEPKALSESEAKKIAKQVWDGKWGNGEERKRRLEQAGYNYFVIQSMVNAMAKGEKAPVAPVKKTYKVVKGDTMWQIAKANGLTLEELIFKNPQIKNPNLIYVGDVINL